jgi:hypothetical protein
MLRHYITAFPVSHATSELSIRSLTLTVMESYVDDDNYSTSRCTDLEAISEMTGWPHVYQTMVF